MQKKGLVQIYTGDGKGKTTAAMGLALRAAGWGLKVGIWQFLKPKSAESGERKALSQIEGITVKLLDEPWDMRKSFSDEKAVEKVRSEIAQVCAEIAEVGAKKTCDLIILDEMVFCLDKGLAQMGDIKKIIDSSDAEIILTGRGAGEELMALADLVTEMKMIKHPYEKNIGARKGIEF